MDDGGVTVALAFGFRAALDFSWTLSWIKIWGRFSKFFVKLSWLTVADVIISKNFLSSCSTKIWLIYIVIEVIAQILFWLGFIFWLNGPWYWVTVISFIILMVANIPRIWSRFVQRQVFLRKQDEMGNLPNYEGCCTSLLLTWFCSPCIFGQMNSALEKSQQRIIVWISVLYLQPGLIGVN